MAVENKWVNSDVEAGRYGQTSQVAGGKVCAIAGTFEVAAADSDTSIFKLARLPSNAVICRAEIYADAITDGTDYDLGFYTDGGVAADVDILADGLDLSSGVAITAASNNGMTSVPIADVGDKVWELLGKTITNKEEGYVLALTANTIGSVAGTISYVVEYVIG